MKRSKFSEEQIAYALRQAEAGTPAGDVCRQLGGSEATFYVWKKKFANLGADKLKALAAVLTKGFGDGLTAFRHAIDAKRTEPDAIGRKRTYVAYLLVAAALPSTGSARPHAKTGHLAQFQVTLLAQINAFRAAHGLSRLKLSPALIAEVEQIVGQGSVSLR